VHLSTVTIDRAQAPAPLFTSTAVARAAKADGWIYLAPPGSFG